MNFTIRQRSKIPQFIFRMFKNHPENGNWWGHYWKHPKDRIATTRSGNSWPSDMLTEVNRAQHYGCPALLLGDHSLYYCTIYRISVSSTVCLLNAGSPGWCSVGVGAVLHWRQQFVVCQNLSEEWLIWKHPCWQLYRVYQSLNPSLAYLGCCMYNGHY